MLKQIAAALLAASVIAAPAFAVDTGASKPAAETGKPVAGAKVQHPRHVRHHLRQHRHVAHVRVKHVKHAKDATAAKKPGETAAPKSPSQSSTVPKSPGQASTTPATR
jgi:hypothetical protein